MPFSNPQCIKVSLVQIAG